MPDPARKPPQPLVRVRIVVQLIFFALFLVLLVMTARGTAVAATPWLAQLFLITDPLVLVGMALAGAFTAGLLAALVIVALSVFLPRAYCGWICPLGTTMDIVDRIFFRGRDRSKNAAPRLRPLKYGLLAALLVLAALRVGVFGWFDPVCIATRSFGVAVYPMADRGAKAGLVAAEQAGASGAGQVYDWAVGQRILILDSDLKGGGYGIGYAWTWVFAALLLAIVAVQAYQKRFWCRNLCPLGAMLGLIGSASPIRPRVSDACISCDACRRRCKTGAFQPRAGHKRYTSLVQECVFCYSCEGQFCPVDAIRIGAGSPGPTAPEPQVCPGRRALLGAIAGGAMLGPAFLLDQRTRNKEETNPQFRPPGAMRPDTEFLATCIRCGACMKVCPTNALHPCGIENGIAGLWTPTFIYNIGYCDFYCGMTKAEVDAGCAEASSAAACAPANLCGAVCPTGAIAKLTQAQKVKWKIGTAVFDKSRCLPWARGEECLTCEEQCPLPEKAISHETSLVAGNEWLKMPQPRRNRYEELEARLAKGPLAPEEAKELAAMPPKMRPLALPYVLRDRCIGCGTCENVCPIDGPGGVRVERLQTREVR